MANGVTTEWEDILVKKGIYNARPKEIPQDQWNQLAQDKAQEYDQLKNKNLNELNELEDDFDDDFLNKYKQQRMNEIIQQQSKPKYGQVMEISREDYVREVNEATKGVFVFLHLYQNYIEKCNLLNHHLNNIAKEYKDVKFLRIQSTRCIENFPDSNLPCVIVYKDGELKNHIPNFDKLNYTQNLTKNSIINVLMKLEIIPKQDIDSEDELMNNLQQYTRGKLGFAQQKKNQDISDSSDDDRGFSNTNL